MSWDDRDNFNKLVGKTILGYTRNANKDQLTFHTDQGNFSYSVYGDCCSHSWFEYVDELDDVIGGKVLEAHSVSMDEVVGYNDTLKKLAQEEEDEGDCIQHYGHKLKTTKGDAIVEFRNSSNGYYGGYMELDS